MLRLGHGGYWQATGTTLQSLVPGMGVQCVSTGPNTRAAQEDATARMFFSPAYDEGPRSTARSVQAASAVWLHRAEDDQSLSWPSTPQRPRGSPRTGCRSRYFQYLRRASLFVSGLRSEYSLQSHLLDSRWVWPVMASPTHQKSATRPVRELKF